MASNKVDRYGKITVVIHMKIPTIAERSVRGAVARFLIRMAGRIGRMPIMISGFTVLYEDETDRDWEESEADLFIAPETMISKN